MPRHLLAAAFVTCVLVVGIGYWPMPYSQVNLPDALYGTGLWLVGGVALALRLAGVARSWKIALLIGSAPAMAVLARVIADTMRDPTSHNLWPFELVIALALGVACAACGAMAGRLLVSLRKSRV